MRAELEPTLEHRTRHPRGMGWPRGSLAWYRGAALAGAAYVLALGLACASPEARRRRGAGSGADVGNRRAAVQLHAGADPYYGTPCVTTLPRCDGPRPVFGPQ
jgi:hypothetical protein